MKKLLIGALSLGIILTPSTAFAAGRANIDIKGNNVAYVGDEIKVDINISNIEDLEDGMVGYTASVGFDNTVLEYVGYEKKENTPYNFIINENNYRIGGLDTTLRNGIKEDTNLYTLKFKVVKAGNTTISLNNIKLSDINAKPIEVANNNSLTISTTEKQVEVEEVKEVVEENKNEVKTTTVSAKKETTTTTAEQTTTTTTKVEETTEKQETVEETKESTKDTVGSIIIKALKNILVSIKNIFR